MDKAPLTSLTSEEARIDEYERSLIRLYGVVIRGKTLRHVLGYKSGAAFRMAVHRNKVPVPTFVLEGRRARMARSRDIAKWLVSLDQELAAVIPPTSDTEPGEDDEIA